jgi:hypothetical protein
MGVRRRAVRERLERKSKMDKGRAEFNASLAKMQRVLNAAAAEGLKTMSQEEFYRRYQADGGSEHGV